MLIVIFLRTFWFDIDEHFEQHRDIIKQLFFHLKILGSFRNEAHATGILFMSLDIFNTELVLRFT